MWACALWSGSRRTSSRPAGEGGTSRRWCCRSATSSRSRPRVPRPWSCRPRPAPTPRSWTGWTPWSSPAGPTWTRRCTTSPRTSRRPGCGRTGTPLRRAALDRGLPLRGICRGMPGPSVVSGGALEQHLPDVVGHERHRPEPGVYGLHGVRLAPGSLAHRLLGDEVSVPSYHHQGLASAGSLTVTGWAEDESPEVGEDPTRRFALGVLWHPEAGDDLRLFEALVGAARG